MEKHLLMTALSGLGIGVGLGWVSGQTMSGKNGPFSSSGVTSEVIEKELRRLVVDGGDGNINFDDFPYYLSEQTRVLLTSAAYVHLKEADISKYTRNLSPASRAILLSGPAELYQQMLAKALAEYFEAKLLLLDATDFSLKIQSKYGILNKESSFKRSISETTLERMSSLFGSFSILPSREESNGIQGLTVDPMMPKVIRNEGNVPKYNRNVECADYKIPNPGTLSRKSNGLDIRSSGSECAGNVPNLGSNASAAADVSTMAGKCASINPAPLKRNSSWSFDEKLLIESLYKVLVSVSKTSPIILYLRDVDKLLFRSQRVHTLFQKLFQKLSGPILILGSRMPNPPNDCSEVEERLTLLFPYNIDIKPPEDEAQLEEDMKMIQFQDKRNHIMEVLAANDLDCDDLGSVCLADTMVPINCIEEIVVSAIFHHQTNNKYPEYRNGKLVISSKSLSHALNIFQESKLGENNTPKMEANAGVVKEPEEGDASGGAPPERRTEASASESKSEEDKSVPVAKKDGENASLPKLPEVPPDNEFEKRIRHEVIPASEIGVTFEDVGALDEVKESLQELVMLPLRRPDLFKGGLLKPFRGILLFGPPGTGKTMMAKAIAREAGASFINVSMSTITSKWFGEDEKNVRALFSLAAKVSPTIIFVDEVDSMLGQRTRVGEHEAMRKIKNEFMTHWDGLMTKPGERILVLAATNRPFDLDEAIIRRFERRIMVGLPSVESREKILRTLLSKEKIEEGLDYKELAVMTEGYSGSDLKNLCMTAAYRPVRELIQKERLKDLEIKKKAAEGQKSEEDSDNKEADKEETVITLRPLNTEDLRQAKNQVAASFAAEGSIMNELKQWNALYGDGGSRKKQQLTYFL